MNNLLYIKMKYFKNLTILPRLGGNKKNLELILELLKY